MPLPEDTRPSPSRTTALLLAAGEGRRVGIGRSKAFLRKHGKTLFAGDLERVAPYCAHRLIGLRAADMDDARPILEPFRAEAVAGGGERIDTVACLLERVSTEFVLVCDVARPHVSGELLERLMAGLAGADADAPVLGLTLRDSLAGRGATAGGRFPCSPSSCGPATG